jgi:hypothetical protein
VYRADLIIKANKWAKRLAALLSGDSAKINAIVAMLATPKVIKSKVSVTTEPTKRVVSNTAYISRQIIAKAGNE